MKTFFKTLLILVLLGLISGAGFYLYRVTAQKYQVQLEINRLKAQVASLEKSNRDLSKLLEMLKDDSFLEKQARAQLNLKKQGEEVVIITKEKKAQKTQTASKQSPPTQTNLWKWWQFFFDKK